MEIETPVLLAYAIEDSTDIFRISGGGVWALQTPPLGTPLDCRINLRFHVWVIGTGYFSVTVVFARHWSLTQFGVFTCQAVCFPQAIFNRISRTCRAWHSTSAHISTANNSCVWFHQPRLREKLEQVWDFPEKCRLLGWRHCWWLEQIRNTAQTWTSWE